MTETVQLAVCLSAVVIVFIIWGTIFGTMKATFCIFGRKLKRVSHAHGEVELESTRERGTSAFRAPSRVILGFFVVLALPCIAATPARQTTITDADIERTVEHMREHAQNLQVLLDAAEKKLATAQAELDHQRDSLKTALMEKDYALVESGKLQSSIDSLREWGQKQEQEAIKQKDRANKLEAAYHKLKGICAAIAALALSFVAWSFLGMFPLQTRLIACAFGAVSGFGLVWMLF